MAHLSAGHHPFFEMALWVFLALYPEETGILLGLPHV
jgi:hypothetical protein